MADRPDWSSLGSLINSRGDKLSKRDALALGGWRAPGVFGGSIPGMDPVMAMTLLTNWLTAGGAPKPIDPVDIFGPMQAMSGVEARASAGRGVAGLFGFGKTIGELSPMAGGPAIPGQAPLAPGVPSYGVKPLPRERGFFK